MLKAAQRVRISLVNPWRVDHGTRGHLQGLDFAGRAPMAGTHLVPILDHIHRPASLIRFFDRSLASGPTHRDRYRQKIARITLDVMAPFVGLLDAKGTVLEINKVTLDAVRITLTEVEGCVLDDFWWQVSREINDAHNQTQFFANVSPEFRTPLTLMLGPLEDSLAETKDAPKPSHRERQELI